MALNYLEDQNHSEDHSHSEYKNHSEGGPNPFIKDGGEITRVMLTKNRNKYCVITTPNL